LIAAISAIAAAAIAIICDYAISLSFIASYSFHAAFSRHYAACLRRAMRDMRHDYFRYHYAAASLFGFRWLRYAISFSPFSLFFR